MPLPSYPFIDSVSSDHCPRGMRLLEDGPVVRARTGTGAEEIEIWLALSHRAVRQVLGDARFSRAAALEAELPALLRVNNLPGVLTSLDPPVHTAFRRLMAGAFSPRMVRGLEPAIQRTTDGLLDALELPGDLIRPFTAALPIMVICELLGVPHRDREQIRAWTFPLLSVHAHAQEELAAALAAIASYVGELIEERRRHPDSRLISAFVATNDRERVMSDAELVTNVQGLLLAGHEATVNQISNSLITLFAHPDQLALVKERPELWPAAIEELMRHSKMTDGILPRIALEDIELEGTRVRAGEVVIPMVAVANRDAAAFPDPYRLDLARPGSAAHLALGHGPHFCLGAQLARMELKVALRSLFTRFPALAPSGPLDELRWKDGLIVRAAVELPVELVAG
ncbi:cytochrome P450 [Streptomyces sp. NPDC001985]|uniref:cytochrome P450 n=1 Tax=Streptomyces sp. NPDC001985 TaxID=3154406 RepID=UPI00332B8CB0